LSRDRLKKNGYERSWVSAEADYLFDWGGLPRPGVSQFVGWTPKVSCSNAMMVLTTDILFDTWIDATPYR
jgi:hypothetical protein